MKRITTVLLGSILAIGTTYSFAHHSFAIYDMSQNVEFEGVIETVRFRNPHMALTMVVSGENGEQQTIDFVEGAPANMLVRLGLKPEFIQPGQSITAIGAPRRDNPNAWFLKAITLPDGRVFNSMQTPNQER